MAIWVNADEMVDRLKWDFDEEYAESIVKDVTSFRSDMVEVVRCKDCIHWYDPEGVCLKIYSDGAVSPYAWQDRNPNDFCSYGERKDNEIY